MPNCIPKGYDNKRQIEVDITKYLGNRINLKPFFSMYFKSHVIPRLASPFLPLKMFLLNDMEYVEWHECLKLEISAFFRYQNNPSQICLKESGINN